MGASYYRQPPYRSTVNLGVTVNPNDKTYFDRFYVCFVGLTDGWKAGCRKVIALDGCCIKSLNQGKLLSAIGRDVNNQIYPVAWAVVNVENKDNWSWFFELLEEDLGCSRGNGLTLMSDQHKGLIEVVKDVMPNAEHRQCARHINENFRKHYYCSNPNAHKYLMDTNSKTWSRAFFEVDRDCEAIKNGFSESFNSVIVSVRHKPLLTMLEAIRVIVLERMKKIREISRKWNPRVCPNIKKRLEMAEGTTKFWHVIPASGNLFEVRSGSEGFTIDEGKKTCSCKMWQLLEIPYVHATKPDKSMYSTVLPLKPKKMPGRPIKKRIISKGIMRDGSKQGGNGGAQQGSTCEVKTQDDPVQTQDDRVQTQADPMQTQDEDQMEQTQEEAEIDLTQVEQTQKHTQDQVQTQEQPEQVTLRRPSARILQRKLAKQGSSQNTAFNV
ncbi:multidrug resistance-associated protein 5 [Tanacetum coccineum]